MRAPAPTLWLCSFLLAVGAGCDCGGVPPGDDGGTDSGAPECTDATQCAAAKGGPPPCGTWACNQNRCEPDCPGCADADRDGYGVPSTAGACAGPDCDDANPAVRETGTRGCYTGPTGTAGVGVCRAGTQTCAAGAWAACQGQVLPAGAEACNLQDDDCNGLVDESPPAVRCGIGACLTTVSSCVDGGAVACVPGTPAADDSVCDGVDNDCDGAVDEDCPGCVKVDPAGNDGTGASSDGGLPFQTLQAAINFAAARNDPAGGGKNVCVSVVSGACPATPLATRVYTTAGPLTMADGISVYGNYTSSGWTRCSANVATVLRPGSPQGVVFPASVQSLTVLDGVVVDRAAPAGTMVAVTVDGARNVVLSSVATGNNPTTSNAWGVNVVDGGEVTILGSSIYSGDGTQTSIGVRAVGSRVTLRQNCALLNDAGSCDYPPGLGCRAGNGIRGRIGTGAALVGESYGVLLEGSPGSVIETSNVCGGIGEYGAAIRIRGDAQGTVVRSSVIAGFGGSIDSHGLWLEDCGGKAPLISRNTAIQTQGTPVTPPPRAEGIHAAGDCHPVIDSNTTIAGGIEGAAANAYGVFCGPNGGGVSARCEILGNRLIAGSGGGFPPQSAGVWCQAGGCNRVERNTISGVRAAQEAYGLWLQRSGATVEGNTLVGAQCARAATAVYAEDSHARIANNKVSGGGAAAACPITPVRFIGLHAVNSAGTREPDVHSNTISGGGVSTVPGCASAALVLSSGTLDGGVAPAAGGKGVYRNNILRAGECPTRAGVWEVDGGADPRVFQHNDLDPAGGGGTTLYRDEGGNAINLIASVNAASDMTAAGNISADPLLVNYAGMDWHLDAGSPCIGAGTPAGAPAVDLDGDARDGAPDIGADEWRP